MGYLKKISSAFLQMDQFGIPLNLRVSNNNVFNTQLGAFTTLLLFAIITRSAYDLFYNLLDRGSPTVIVNEVYNTSPGKYNLLPEDFDLAFMIHGGDGKLIGYEETLLVTEPLFYFARFLGEEPEAFNPVQFIPCILDPKNEDRIRTTVGTVQQIFSKGLCLNKTNWREKIDETYLLGAYADYNLSQIRFGLNKSQNVSETLRQKLENGNVYLTYPDISINQQDKKNPLKSHFILKIIGLSLSTYRRSRCSLQVLDFLDDYNPWNFFPNTVNYQALKIQQEDNALYSSNLQLLDIGWVLDNVSTSYIRTYPTILDVLGNLGGFYSLLFYIFGIFITPIAQTQCNLTLINDIFDFQEFNQTSQVYDEKSLQKSKTLKDIKKIEKKNLKIRYNLMATLRQTLCKKKVYIKAEEKINKYLDFLTIVKQCNNLKYLQKILLSKDQMLLFKHRQKPKFKNYDNQTQKMGDVKLDFLSVYQSYRNIKSVQTPGNQVILQHIDGSIWRYISQQEQNQEYKTENDNNYNPTINNLHTSIKDRNSQELIDNL